MKSRLFQRMIGDAKDLLIMVIIFSFNYYISFPILTYITHSVYDFDTFMSFISFIVLNVINMSLAIWAIRNLDKILNFKL